MRPFHTALLYADQPPVDRVAWILASVTVPPLIRGEFETHEYHREHKKLQQIEIHRRASRIRMALKDLLEHTQRKRDDNFIKVRDRSPRQGQENTDVSGGTLKECPPPQPTGDEEQEDL